jgi:7-carboxy-7-deazaguanine synthase
VTGGEPLAQPNAIPLLERLCDAGYEVSLETSGALDISKVDSARQSCCRLEDARVERSRPQPIREHRSADSNDQVKFVICSREDYDWAVSKLIQYGLDRRAGEVLFSPVHRDLNVPGTWPTGSWQTTCRYVCNCSCIKFSGTTSRGAE